MHSVVRERLPCVSSYRTLLGRQPGLVAAVVTRLSQMLRDLQDLLAGVQARHGRGRAGMYDAVRCAVCDIGLLTVQEGGWCMCAGKRGAGVCVCVCVQAREGPVWAV